MWEKIKNFFSVDSFKTFSITIGIKVFFTLTIIAIAWLSLAVCRKYLIKFIRYFIEKHKFKWGQVLFKHKLFLRLSYLFTTLILYLLLPLAYQDMEQLSFFFKRTLEILMVLITLFVIYGVFNAMHEIYATFKVSRDKPIKGFLQVIKIILAFVAIIVILSLILNKSPTILIGSLGALTAVLLLVFKDPILGFVANFQLSANNMVRVGDWIEMPKHGANGDVFDISIASVKVLNFDKTITTIPTYSLISDSFKNWRGMYESGGRRIKRSIFIDLRSIGFCNEALIAKLQGIKLLSDYVEKHKNQEMTNLGAFRAYISAYLKNHPKIHAQTMTFLVRHLDPTEHGLPLEIYVFTNDQIWSHYEEIQAEIFEHIIAISAQFQLDLYQQPSGKDVEKLHILNATSTS